MNTFFTILAGKFDMFEQQYSPGGHDDIIFEAATQGFMTCRKKAPLSTIEECRYLSRYIRDRIDCSLKQPGNTVSSRYDFWMSMGPGKQRFDWVSWRETGPNPCSPGTFPLCGLQGGAALQISRVIDNLEGGSDLKRSTWALL